MMSEIESRYRMALESIKLIAVRASNSAGAAEAVYAIGHIASIAEQALTHEPAPEPIERPFTGPR